jgi:hypothetical protein
MNWLLETPWPAILLGATAEIILAIVFFTIQRRWVMIAMGVVAALMVGAFLLERVVVTPTEEVDTALQQLAASLEANDVPAILSLVAPDAAGVRGAAERHMPRYQINAVHIARDLTITVDDKSDPPTAVATFTCRVNANDKRGQLPYQNAILQFSIKYRKYGESWLVYEYDVDRPEIRMGR